jgi:histidine triad (HIT) family protein
MPASEAGELLSALPKLCAAVVKAAGADGFNIHQTNGPCAGQVVPHVHFHVIPRHDGDGYSFHWRSGKCSAADLEAWQRKIVEAMKGKA